MTSKRPLSAPTAAPVAASQLRLWPDEATEAEVIAMIETAALAADSPAPAAGESRPRGRVLDTIRSFRKALIAYLDEADIPPAVAQGHVPPSWRARVAAHLEGLAAQRRAVGLEASAHEQLAAELRGEPLRRSCGRTGGDQPSEEALSGAELHTMWLSLAEDRRYAFMLDLGEEASDRLLAYQLATRPAVPEPTVFSEPLVFPAPAHPSRGARSRRRRQAEAVAAD